MEEPRIDSDPTHFLQASVDMTIRIGQETTCRKFNDMMSQFLLALQKAYAKVPEIVPKIKLQSQIITQLMERDPQFVLTHYKASCEGGLSIERDEFIQTMLPKVGVFRGFQIHQYWDKTPEKTKKSIWLYLNHLWNFCEQFDECGDQELLTSHALKMLKSTEFATLMEKTLSVRI